MNIATHAKVLSLILDRVVQITCVLLLTLLVLDVWLGIMARYVLPFSLTFTEELARYLMIWMALLAVSSGIVHRQHIGVEFVFDRFPPKGAVLWPFPLTLLLSPSLRRCSGLVWILSNAASSAPP